MTTDRTINNNLIKGIILSLNVRWVVLCVVFEDNYPPKESEHQRVERIPESRG